MRDLSELENDFVVAVVKIDRGEVDDLPEDLVHEAVSAFTTETADATDRAITLNVRLTEFDAFMERVGTRARETTNA